MRIYLFEINIDRRIHELIYDFGVCRPYVNAEGLRCIVLVQHSARNYMYAKSGYGLAVLQSLGKS
jgi:hypothetical protein